MKRPNKFDNNGGLITFEDENGIQRYVNYLFYFNGKGTFEPNFGLLEGITKEQADEHNKILSRLQLEGLDKQCEVGQVGQFYLKRNPLDVRTWIGESLGTATWKGLRDVVVRRNGRVFVGRARKASSDDETINMKRVS